MIRLPVVCLFVCLTVGLASIGCNRERALAVRRLNQALKQYDEGDDKAAIALLKRAAEADSSFAKPHYQLGQIYEFDQSDLEAAETHYRRATALAPERPAYQYALGRLLEKRGDSEGAAAALKRAVKARERYPRAWFRLGLGDLYVRFGFYHKALKVFENGIANNPDAARLYRGRGTAQLRLDRHEAAASSFEKALELDPGVATAYFNLAVARRKAGDRSGAIRALKRYLDRAARRKDRAKIAAARGMIQNLETASGSEKN
ncbi:MAG: tetratricopeptide repeat protein [Bradymonadaceae bacterium]